VRGASRYHHDATRLDLDQASVHHAQMTVHDIDESVLGVRYLPVKLHQAKLFVQDECRTSIIPSLMLFL